MNINLKKFIEKQMLPQKPLNEGEDLNEDEALLEDILNEDDVNYQLNEFYDFCDNLNIWIEL